MTSGLGVSGLYQPNSHTHIQKQNNTFHDYIYIYIYIYCVYYSDQPVGI